MMKQNTSTMNRRGVRLVAMTAAIGAAVALSGCNAAQTGALLGAGYGALGGQAIGGNTESTLIGTGVGTAAGYMIGNEIDKSRQPSYNYRY